MFRCNLGLHTGLPPSHQQHLPLERPRCMSRPPPNVKPKQPVPNKMRYTKCTWCRYSLMPDQPGEHESPQPTGRNQRLSRTQPLGPLWVVRGLWRTMSSMQTSKRFYIRRIKTCFVVLITSTRQHLQEIGLGKATIQWKRKRPIELVK